ncbi:MAG: SUF system NifU family Fe-S cluster assembly protein [Fimbriimonadaceae bacterium]|nr:SUF system NifU family Fe-S cluster assembly protein [Fimbriimonadaceae bacterium]
MDLRDLYQETILEHARRPRNRRSLPDATASAEGHNPMCGDHVRLALQVSDAGRIEDAAYTAEGCAICMSSASMLTEVIVGKSVADAETIFRSVQATLTGQADDELPGDLSALIGVRTLPVRIKCALLAWHALSACLHPAESPGERTHA